MEVIEDGGISGSCPLADRPGGARIAALLTARNPEAALVVIARLDRLGRSAAETLAYLRQFSEGGVGLVSVADRLDLSSPQGRAMAQISCVFGELEKALISERTANALCELRSRGKAYSPTPFGFKRHGDDLVPDEPEQKVLGRMRRLRAKGKSYRDIASSLNKSGIPSKKGGIWFASSTRSVLLTAPKLEQATG